MNNVGIHLPSLSGPASGVATYGLESAWPAPLRSLVVQPLWAASGQLWQLWPCKTVRL